MASMEKFENVEQLFTKANIYFDGKVVSHTFHIKGERKTMGVIFPGEYEFGTGDAEVMNMITGKVDILLPDSSSWTTCSAGEFFNVPANSKFKMKTGAIAEYVCEYIKI